MRILLLSAYDAASHRQWRQALVSHMREHDWTQLTLEPRFFSWRIRGNALSWFSENLQTLNKQSYDLVIATSMVDLATLKGLVPALATTPSILYFHENQFAYPESDHTHSNVEAQITSIYSAMSADQLLFNSTYNCETFLQGAKTLLKKMPDHAPLSVITALEAKSSKLPVPIDDICFKQKEGYPDKPVTLVWNHRWEYDKGPDRLYLVLKELLRRELDFRIHLLGQRFRRWPEVFDQIKKEFNTQLLNWGYIKNRHDYLQVLRQSDLVISTALHDFQGISMMEAAACGAVTIAPDRLAYPEYLPAHHRYGSSIENPELEATAAAELIMQIAAAGKRQKTDLSHLSWGNQLNEYRNIIQAVANQQPSRHQ